MSLHLISSRVGWCAACLLANSRETDLIYWPYYGVITREYRRADWPCGCADWMRVGARACARSRVRVARPFYRVCIIVTSVQAVPTELPSVHHRGADRWCDNTWRVARTRQGCVSPVKSRNSNPDANVTPAIGRYAAAPDAGCCVVFNRRPVSRVNVSNRSPPRPRMTRAERVKFIINSRKY